MQGKIIGQSGGSKINGIIEEYKVASGGNVNAGDFVEYLSKINIGTDTKLSSTENSGYTISAIVLNDNTVFIAYRYGSNYYLYGTIVTINNDVITIGTDTQLSNVENSGATISAVKIGENKIFIAHSYDSNYYLYGVIITIDGTTITVGSDTRLSDFIQVRTISTIMLYANKIFIAYRYGSNCYLNGVIVTIDGDTMTAGTNTQLSTISYTGSVISAVKLNANKIFIAHSYDSNYYLYGIIVTIDENTIIVGNDINLNTTTYSHTGRKISSVALNENKVFIVYGADGLRALICTIEETTVTIKNDVLLNDDSYSKDGFSVIKLTENKVFVLHSYNENRYLYGVEVLIDNTSITAKTDLQLSNITYSGLKMSVSLEEGTIFIAHSNSTSYYLNGMFNEYIKGVTPVISSSQTIHGVAKTKGTEGQTVKVYVPNV